MSVLARALAEPHLLLYCKGAPETVANLCVYSSVPENFATILQRYARHGYRVLAVAQRKLKLSFVKAQSVSRQQVRQDRRANLPPRRTTPATPAAPFGVYFLRSKSGMQYFYAVLRQEFGLFVCPIQLEAPGGPHLHI